MQKIKFSQSDFDPYLNMLQALSFKAGEMVPNENELSVVMFPNMSDYFDLLMWINNTGTKTKENATCRNLIRKKLNTSILFANNTDQEEAECSVIRYSYKEYDNLTSQMSSLSFKADDRVPTETDLCNIMIPNFSKFAGLLLWIEETGYETKENKECRRLIRKALSVNIELTDDVNEENDGSSIPDATDKKSDSITNPVNEEALILSIGARVQCTYDDYDKYITLFHKQHYKAADYVPEKSELLNIILPDLPKYILMLIWIIETGEETEENAGTRKLIRKILTLCLELIDNTEKEQ